jgi:uncharacterized protein YaaQ
MVNRDKEKDRALHGALHRALYRASHGEYLADGNGTLLIGGIGQAEVPGNVWTMEFY